MYHRPETLALADEKRIAASQSIPEKDLIEMMLGYSLGDYLFMSTELKKAHQSLYLGHLFTPSGLHLSLILGPLRPLILALECAWPRAIPWGLGLIFALIPSFLNGFEALNRLFYLHALAFITKQDSWQLFLLVFGAHLVKWPPSLSYIYSFLFYGSILALKEKKWPVILLGLAGGQLLASLFMGQSWSPISMLKGMFLTAVFGFMFPPTLLLFWTWGLPWARYPLLLFYKMIFFFNRPGVL